MDDAREAAQDAPTTLDAPREDDGSLAEDALAPDASQTWCDTHQGTELFCDDFDTSALPLPFASEVTLGSGTLSYSVNDYQSAPRALLASLPAAASTAGDGGSEALLSRTFSRDGTHITLQADIEVGAGCFANATTQESVTLLAFSFEKQSYALVLVETVGGTVLRELTLGADGGVAGSSDHELSPGIPAGRWTTLNVDAQLGLAKTVTASVAGTRALSTKLSLAPVALAEPTLRLGAARDGAPVAAPAPAPACMVRVDDVLFDIKL